MINRLLNNFQRSACQDPELNEEEHLFKNLRAFQVTKKDLQFDFFIYFPDAVQQQQLLFYRSKTLQLQQAIVMELILLI